MMTKKLRTTSILSRIADVIGPQGLPRALLSCWVIYIHKTSEELKGHRTNSLLTPGLVADSMMDGKLKIKISKS